MRVLCFVSSAGGCGKSLIVKNLSVALSSDYKKVLVAEMCYDRRYLDILFDVTDSILYNISDFENNNATIEECICQVDDMLSLISSPLERKQFDMGKCFLEIFRYASDKYDYLIIDASYEAIPKLMSVNSDVEFIIVSEPHSMFMRNTEALISMIGNCNNVSLIINRVNPYRIEKGYDCGVDEMIDSLHIPLLGVVYDFEGGFDNNMELINKDDKILSKRIFECIIGRLNGKNIPISDYKKSNIVKRFFG